MFLNVLFSLSKQKGARSFIDERIICPAHLLISNLQRIFGHKPVQRRNILCNMCQCDSTRSSIMYISNLYQKHHFLVHHNKAIQPAKYKLTIIIELLFHEMRRAEFGVSAKQIFGKRQRLFQTYISVKGVRYSFENSKTSLSVSLFVNNYASFADRVLRAKIHSPRSWFAQFIQSLCRQSRTTQTQISQLIYVIVVSPPLVSHEV